MKKDKKTGKRKLQLETVTVKQLDENQLQHVQGGGSCYKPPEES